MGDRVGMGPVCYSCGECSACSEDAFNCCRAGVFTTYDSRYPNGEKTNGGYGKKWRGNKQYVVKIPDNVTSENACTMLCAGVSTFAPLKRWNTNCTSVVGILGLGGLGHFGVLFAKALGARVVVLSHSEDKRQVALELGADEFVNTTNSEEMNKLKFSLTHILCTGMGKDFKCKNSKLYDDIPTTIYSMYFLHLGETFFPLFKVNGVFINLGIPSFELPTIPAFHFANSQIAIASSFVGKVKNHINTKQFYLIDVSFFWGVIPL